MDTCYICGRNAEQVAALLVAESLREIDEKLAALAKEKESLANSFGDLTAVWNSLNSKLKTLNTDIFSLNLETLERNFGNAKTNLVSEVLEFLKKTPDFRMESFSLQDVAANFEKYRPRNVRTEEIEREIVELELRKKSAGGKFAGSHGLLEPKILEAKSDYLKPGLQFAVVDRQPEAKADAVRLSVCRVCLALLKHAAG